MVGRNAGYITTQGQITADLFASDGFDVACVSSKLNRVTRLLEIIVTLIANSRRFDIVSLEVYGGMGFFIADISSLLCKAVGLPLVMVLHGGGLPELAEKRPRWIKRVLSRADRLVAPSPFLAGEMSRRGFEVQVIPNVIDLDAYPFRKRSKLLPHLMWMRSFHPTYNPEMAVNVLAELRKTAPEATLTMAGVDKGLLPKIKSLVEEMNLSDAVSFPGFLGADEKKKLFQNASIFLNTNRIDNMPVAVVEARAFGLPVVATNVGGLPMLISNGENGLLVENENVRQMVDAVKLLLNDSDLAQKLSANGRMLAERSAWTAVRARWEEVFADVLCKRSENSASEFGTSNLAAEKSKGSI